MPAPRRVGVLALQGAFREHLSMLQKIGVEGVEVRIPEDLQNIDGLILPGGESTTITKLLRIQGLEPLLKEWNKPLFGTCAGLIILSKEVADKSVEPYGKIDVVVERNSYGRQQDSFCTPLTFENTTFNGVFIRAPRIHSVGHGLQILLRHNNDPVLVLENNVLGATFHPELSGSSVIHDYFMRMIESIR